MNINDQQASLIKQAISQEHQAIDALFQLLQQEQAALKANKLELLEPLASQKQSLLIEIDKFNQQRRNALQSLGIEDDAKQFEALLQQQLPSTQEKLFPTWQAFKVMVQQCNDLNEVNGAAIAVNLHNTLDILGVLKGRDGSNDLYGATGKMRSQSGPSGHTEA